MTIKDSSKNLVGQPIFKQLIDFIPKSVFDVLVIKHSIDKHYRTFPAWTQLVTMLFGIFSRCDSMGEICDAMMGLQGKLNHLGLKSSPAKSTAGDGLRERNNIFFEDLYFKLLDHFKPILSVSRIKKRFVQGSVYLRLKYYQAFFQTS
jgi:hypothetical protein